MSTAKTAKPAIDDIELDRSDWELVTFGDVALKQNTSVDRENTDLTRYVAGEHMRSEDLHLREWGELGEDYLGPAFTRKFCKGDILYGSRRTYLRKVAVAHFDGITANTTFVIKPNEERIIKGLLPFVMLAEGFTQHSIRNSKGSVNPYINWKDIAHYEFLLPPKEQQAKLIELLWAADEVASTADAAFEKSDKARRSFLRQSFAHRHEFKTRRVADAGEVKMGRQRAPKYQTGKLTKPYLRVANVFDCFFDYSDVLSMDFDERDFETFRLQKGDILLNEGQSRELVGRCAIYDGAIDDCCFQNTLIRYRAGEDILSEYAFAYFQFCFNFGRFSAISGQTTSVAHLGADRFGSLRLPIPPKDIQREIAENDEQMRRVTAEQKSHRKICRELLKSLINQIF